ncbi:hypothetical protein HanXRQr2_Chr04g0181541 [Helianthus annuus]|uniref:Uncharacterized protein n=1 Tax=Helianthus annuus TaxID=4232 RepID=A0A9K3JAN7_HELAN|nr:hypothetical protein HanXRQr2_Chr04g0181541 [Helianthus annuus]
MEVEEEEIMEVEEESDFSDRDLTAESESDFSDMDLTAHKTKTPKRGLTRLPKMRTAFTNSGGKKHKVTFDELEKFSGEYRSEFSSFLGDLVREYVGFRFLAWKTVPTEVKDKLWEEITVNSFLLIINVFLHFHVTNIQLVQNNELSVDEIPSRALMWRKARENKNGEYKNVDVKDIANKIVN